MPVLAGFRLMWRNGPFKRLMIAFVLGGIGKRRAWMSGMSVMLIAQPWYLTLGPGDLALMMGILFLSGLSAGSFVALPSAMKADVIDVDRLESGEDRTGLFFSTWSLAQKAIVAWATGLALLILEFAGFEPTGQNGPEQIRALKIAFPASRCCATRPPCGSFALTRSPKRATPRC